MQLLQRLKVIASAIVRSSLIKPAAPFAGFLSSLFPLSPFVRGDSLYQKHEIVSRNTRDSRLSYGKNPKSLSHLGLERYRDMALKQTDRRTDRQTDRITVANTHYS